MGPRPTSPALTDAVRLAPVTVHEQGGMRAGVVLALLLQTAISGGTYLVAKRALAEVPVQTLVLWRFILSGAVFAGSWPFFPVPRCHPAARWARCSSSGCSPGR